MQVNNLNFSISNKSILNDVSFIINKNDKIGLVGKNGSGKSSLLKILSKELPYEKGSIKLENEDIAYLKQEIPHSFNDDSILTFIKKEIGLFEIEERLHFLESNLNEKNLEEYSEILEKYLSLDGYNFEDNANEILNGLKLNKTLQDKINILSGGEKIKILLSVVLLSNSNLLLLDEPTNNLDIKAVEWLENYLKNSKKEMIIVSHDEVFLNNITNRIFELNNGNLKEYSMTYNSYVEAKELEYKRNFEQYNNALEKKENLKRQIQKAKEWANKGNNKKSYSDNDKIANNFSKEKTNNSNISKINRALEKVEIPEFEEKKSINFFFQFDNSKGNKDILLENLVCGYEKKFVTSPINLQIDFGSKISISGSNGCGKTTLIKTIMGLLKPLSGKCIIGNDVKIGYISQDTIFEDNDETILEFLTKNVSNIDYSVIYMLLDKFNFEYDDRNKKYKNLSPGERTRVNLIKIALNKINVLILDEVTNHLDKEALDIIYELIENYNGTIISISHNRKYNEILNADFEFNIENNLVTYPSHEESLRNK